MVNTLNNKQSLYKILRFYLSPVMFKVFQVLSISLQDSLCTSWFNSLPRSIQITSRNISAFFLLEFQLQWTRDIFDIFVKIFTKMWKFSKTKANFSSFFFFDIWIKVLQRYFFVILNSIILEWFCIKQYRAYAHNL